MPTMNISLTRQLADFVREKVASGLYSNASEVMREGLRLFRQKDEQERLKLAILKREALKGVEAGNRGEYTHQSLDEIAAEEQAEFGAELRTL